MWINSSHLIDLRMNSIRWLLPHFKFTYAEICLPFYCPIQFHNVLLHFFNYSIVTIPDHLLSFGSFLTVSPISSSRPLRNLSGNPVQNPSELCWWLPLVSCRLYLFLFFANLSNWGLYGSSWILWVIPLSFYTGLVASDFHLDKCYENKLADLQGKKSCCNTHTLVFVSPVGSLTWVTLEP